MNAKMKNDLHTIAYDALVAAGLSDLIGHKWSSEYAEGCDTPNMLAELCGGPGLAGWGAVKDRAMFAIAYLKTGHAPLILRGGVARTATPYPSTAEWLLKRRLETNP